MIGHIIQNTVTVLSNRIGDPEGIGRARFLRAFVDEMKQINGKTKHVCSTRDP